jgi:hypothetical protein
MDTYPALVKQFVFHMAFTRAPVRPTLPAGPESQYQSDSLAVLPQDGLWTLDLGKPFTDRHTSEAEKIHERKKRESSSKSKFMK